MWQWYFNWFHKQFTILFSLHAIWLSHNSLCCVFNVLYVIRWLFEKILVIWYNIHYRYLISHGFCQRMQRKRTRFLSHWMHNLRGAENPSTLIWNTVENQKSRGKDPSDFFQLYFMKMIKILSISKSHKSVLCMLIKEI